MKNRLRRLRHSPALRQMVQETELRPSDFIYPLFVRHGQNIRLEVKSMPGVFQFSVDQLAEEAKEIVSLGIPAVMLFGIPAEKDALGSENFSPTGIIQQAIRAIKSAAPELIVVTDLCMCEYTDHGHCGVINAQGSPDYNPRVPEGYVLNDPTLKILQQAALSHAQAGADLIAPSGMIDGMVAAIRSILDDNGFEHISVLSYSVKYASAFYGPFRDAAESPPAFGDRRTHQMNPANVREALRETALDVAEGADLLMVKPALPYLDVLYRVRAAYPELPLVAYNVSGEYAMIKAAAINGWLDEKSVVLEALTGVKRAGADLIITYHAKDAVRWLGE
ncbi:MAG: porphobilinogen synthase [Anaerolineales bacterium]|nr:porphobilinogen synthase [Anaerolineales bacterium]